MSEIKSEKAKERIEYYSNDTDFIYPLTKEQIVEVVAIAEIEAEEGHAKEVQYLKDRAVYLFRDFVVDYAYEAGYTEIERDAEHHIKVFTQRLNEQ